MNPLLPLAYNQSRAKELDDVKTASNAIVSEELVSSQKQPQDAFSTQPTISSDYSDRITLPDSSSSCPGSDLNLFKHRQDSIVQLSGVPSSPPMLGIDDDNDSYADKENRTKRKTQLLSSPPEFSRNNSVMSDVQQPKRKRRQVLLHKPKAIGEELALDRDGKVYGVLLEDSTFPRGYRPSLYDDPAYFVVKNPPELIARSSEIIDETFDRDPEKENYEAYMLNLDKCGLQSLPDQILDFKDLVIYNKEGQIAPPSLQIFASNNELRSLSPRIFEIRGLSVLTLRGNKIARIPSAIGAATSLRSLNIANNKIKFLPPTILNCDKLEIIRIRPNQLIEANNQKDLREVDAPEGSEFHKYDRYLRFVGKLHWITSNKQVSGAAVTAIKLARNLSTLQDSEGQFASSDALANQEQNYIRKRASWVPKLSELSCRTISRYLISRSEILKWRDTTHERVYKQAIKALIHGTNGEVCGCCGNTVVESVAELLEWWDFKDSKLIPIKRSFCSKRCAEVWWAKIEPSIK